MALVLYDQWRAFSDKHANYQLLQCGCYAELSVRNRLPIMQNGQQLRRNYCVFWIKEQTNYYIEEFVELLKKLLNNEKQV